MAGKVLVTETRLDETGGSVRARILIKAPATRIWNVVSQCEFALRYLAGMEECEIFIDEPTRAMTRHVVDAGIFAPTLDYTFETLREPYTIMEFSLESGNVKQIEGYWSFEPSEFGVILEHEIHLQPKTPAPRWFVRRKLKKDLPRMMLCIRGMSDGSPGSTTQQKDLAACQESALIEDQ